MSTLSGNATKGEKGKKFQQLKINLCTANKPSEPEQQQHKSNIQRKQHGMTSLGKVPTARRPTNLPSEKSEHSGNDPSVNLVPSGGAGWGNKQNEIGPTTTSSVDSVANPPISVPVNSMTTSGTSQPVQHVQHYPPTSRMPPLAPTGHAPVHHGHTDVKTWAMMTHGGDSSAPNFLAPQSPLFQQQFPSLSSNSETSSSSTLVTATATQKPTANSTADIQYGPGPSLRPQTEGSWIQGGSRPQGSVGATSANTTTSTPAQVRPIIPYPPPVGPDGARNTLGPSGVGVVPGGPYSGPVLSQHMIPPQYGGIMPPYMLRNTYPGGFPPNFQGKGVGPRLSYGSYLPSGPHVSSERFIQPPNSVANSAKRPYDDEDIKIRPIIKEEDLNQMASIGYDIGWAGNEDIDYNQKLKFSDDEDDDKTKDNRNKLRKQQTSLKVTEKNVTKKESSEKDTDKNPELLKDKEKFMNYETRSQTAWQSRRTIMAAQSTTRYQKPMVSGRLEEDDDDWQERRRQKSHEMELIIQRAKERKEEEEKRYIESQQAAAIKLKKLEEQMFGSQLRNNKENKEPFPNDSEIDMLPEWEKEKLKKEQKVNHENHCNEELKKSQNSATPVPVVKDASEFRELTQQLMDRSNYVKKDTDRDNAAVNYSRPFNNNIPPRFQNLNRHNSAGLINSSFIQNADKRNTSSQSQFTNKLSNSNSGNSRLERLDSDSLIDKEKDWNIDENLCSDRYGSEDRNDDRYQLSPLKEREYGYDRDNDLKYEDKSNKEYETKRKFCNFTKDDYSNDLHHDFDKESSHNSKINRINNTESDRDKVKYENNHRYIEYENQESGADVKWRSNSELRSSRFSENESHIHDLKKSRDEGHYENLKSYNAERERETYKKLETYGRDKESDREKELNRECKENDSINQKDRDYDMRSGHDLYSNSKDSERRLISYEERISRNEMKESRFHRESRESLREESYMIQDDRAYSWADDTDFDEKPQMRKDHYRIDHSDRYSHAQRHIPGPITREKLEAKELESESKRNLTPLIRSDKKIDNKADTEDKSNKDHKEKLDKLIVTTVVSTSSCNNVITSSTSIAGVKVENIETFSQQKKDDQFAPPSVWNKDHKKKDESSLLTHSNETLNNKNNQYKDKEDKKDTIKAASKMEDQTKNNDDKRNNERHRNERSTKRDLGRNWTRYSAYNRNSYGSSTSRNELKSRKPVKGSSVSGSNKNVSQRRDKYSESDYSDEISGSGKDDKNLRSERDKLSRSMKSTTKRYDRDDRNRDYRIDERDYMSNNRSRSNRDSYYYGKPVPRSRNTGNNNGGYRNTINSASKRMDCYGPPLPKNSFGNQISYGEDKKSKSSITKETTGNVQSGTEITTDSKNSSENKQLNGKNIIRQYHKETDKSGWKKGENDVTDTKSSSLTVEVTEESFATASEGSDSDDGNAQSLKNKNNYESTKRSAVVVVPKPQRRNFSRSTSRKRYENRKSASLFVRKESVTYNNKRNSMASSSNINKITKEHDKSSRTVTSTHINQETDLKSTEKSHREYSDSHLKKVVKTRNRSNSRRNNRNNVIGVPANGTIVGNRNKSSQETSSRLIKSKGQIDSKSSGDHKDVKNFEIPTPLFKEPGPPIPAPPPTVNAWDKPITSALKTGSSSISNSNSSVSGSNSTTTTVIVQEKSSIVQITEQHSESSVQSSDISPLSTISAEKVTTKVLENLDGASPPVQTIIFENTNYKSGPNDLSSKSKYCSQLKNHRFDKVSNFGVNSTNSDLTGSKHEPLHNMTLSYKNEDVTDMKLDFTFDSEFSKLTDENKNAKTMELSSHTMQMVHSSTDADLNFKIASVKKVWDGSLEFYDDKYDSGMVSTSTSFTPSFSSHGTDPNSGSCYVSAHVENSAHVQVDDVGSLGHNEVVFNPVSQIQGVTSNYGSSTNCQTVVMKNDSISSSSNVCKVKPQPQGCNTANLSNVGQSNVISTTLPISSPSYTFSCSTPQTNLNNNPGIATALAQAQHSFQAQAQYNMYTPQASAPAASGMYQAYQIDSSQVAARSQLNQYPSYGLGQTSTFNQQSVFVPPPNAAPPPEIYQAPMAPYRLQTQAFSNQPITNPNTVLISSTSNSLMSASIKPPSNQPINAVGSKNAYQTQASQFYIPLEQATLYNNVFASTQLIPRPGNNVATGSLQGSTTSFYSGSGAGQASAFFQPATNTALQPQAGTAIGLTGFNTQSAAPSLGSTQIQNFASQLTQQYRSVSNSYSKNSGNTANIASDFGNGKTVNISSQHDTLNPVFQAGSQLSSAKTRLSGGGKNSGTVPQVIAQHSMPNTYFPTTNQMRNSGNGSKGSQYPHPIQRPGSQGSNANRTGNNSSNVSSSHRMPAARNNSHQLVNNIQQPPSSVYYSPSSGYNNSTTSSKLETSQLDTKNESNSDSKLADNIKTINVKNSCTPTEKTATNE